jgi:hypothetical protein
MTSFDFITQAAHASLGGNVVMLAIVFTDGDRNKVLAVALAFVLAYAAPKEFLYDALYELPAQTPKENWTDFAFLTLGAILGVGVFFLHWAITP